jgi:EmrB/QacA subfamily drug resistance transporter
LSIETEQCQHILDYAIRFVNLNIMEIIMDNAINKRSALLVATVGAFLTPFMGSAINIALPSIGEEFAINAIVLSWIPTAYLLAAAIFLVPFGRIADIYGRKRIFTYGILIYTISSILAAISTSAALLIAFRVLQGIGSAILFGTGTAILTSVFPPGERGKALGINVAAVYLGLSVGPFLGGFLTQRFGWRSIFLANIPLGVVVIVFVFWKLRGEWAESKGERFDFIGTLIYSLTLIAIMYGFSTLSKPIGTRLILAWVTVPLPPWLARTTIGAWLILAGVLGALAFVLWEMRSKNPVLDIKLFQNNKVFALSNLAALINYSATSAVGFLLSLYLQYIKGLSPQNAGLVLVSQPIIMTAFSPFAGRLSDRIEPRIVASIGMALTVVGLFLLTFLKESTPLASIITSLILLGFGFAFFSSPNTNAVMGSVEKRAYGVASATLGTMRLTGQAFSMGFATLVFALYIGSAQITPAYYSLFLRSVKVLSIIFALLCFGGIFASLARGKVR